MAKIKRYFSEKQFMNVKNDMSFLTNAVVNSCGELDFQIRPGNKINLYYKGNSLAQITCNNNSYRVSVNKKFGLKEVIKEFIDKDKLKRFDSYKNFCEADENKNEPGYDSVSVDRNLIHPLLQKSTLEALMSNIKKVNNGEEIDFEQSLMTDNLFRPDYILIDRQVGGGSLGKKMLDLLALRRTGNEEYQLEVVEVKLGNNKELRGDVIGQTENYVNSIKSDLDNFRFCYEKNYEQKKSLGLFPDSWSEKISIGKEVSGKIVVGYYSGILGRYMENLKNECLKKSFDLQIFTNKLT